MSRNALGLIEVVGKLAAVEAADIALKAANVTLLGMENATGALITVKLEGDVGAVQAAVDAARMGAGRVGTVVAAHVLPRPASGISPLLKQAPQAGCGKAPAPVPEAPVIQVGTEEPLPLAAAPEPVEELVTEPAAESEAAMDAEPDLLTVEEDNSAAICNICHDPACPREKGQSVKLCIHGRRK